MTGVSAFDKNPTQPLADAAYGFDKVTEYRLVSPILL